MSEGKATTRQTHVQQSLVAAYERGVLVPFLGAGMSAPPAMKATSDAVDRTPPHRDRRGGLPLWAEFVTELERRGGRTPSPGTDLVQRAASAVRRLRHTSDDGLADGVRDALGRIPCSTPDQLAPLASVHWPLVLTTNYDDLYVAVAHEAQVAHEGTGSRGNGKREVVPLELLGRSERDCQEVLASLRWPARPVLWALQGFVGGQAAVPDRLGRRHRGVTTYSQAVNSDLHYAAQVRRLGAELVVGHAEYRRVALRSESFRRSFAEVFRTRSLLFLGSSLSDRYLLDLFSEVIELYGPSPLPHFAFVKKGEADPLFLRQYFGIWVVEMAGFDELPGQLDALIRDLTNPRLPPLRWSHDDRLPSTRRSGRRSGGLEVVEGSLGIDVVGDRECLAISAGGTSERRFHLSNVGKTLLSGMHLGSKREDFHAVDDIGPDALTIMRHNDLENLFAVVARLNPWSEVGWRTRPVDPTIRPLGKAPAPTLNAATMRDVRVVELASRQLLSLAARESYTRVHSMLLAAGSRRTFPQSLALLQMIRAWSRTRRDGDEQVGLTIYVHPTAEGVLLDLRTGRLDPRTGLDPEWFQFWIELELHGAPYARYLALENASRPLLDIAAGFDVSDDDWGVDVRPSPSARFANWTIGHVRRWEESFPPEPMTLERIGVLPGSMLRFSKTDSATR